MSTRSFTDVHVHVDTPMDDWSEDAEATEAEVVVANDDIATMVAAAAGTTLGGTVDKVLLTIPPLSSSNARGYLVDFRELDTFASGQDSSGGESIIAGVVVGGRRINLLLQAYDAAADSTEQERVHDALTRILDAASPTDVMANQVAIGEIAILHVSADNADNPFIYVDPTSAPMGDLLAFAALYQLPVDIHMEIVPCDVATAEIVAVGRRGGTIVLYDPEKSEAENVNPPTLVRNVEDFQDLLDMAHSAGAKIVLEHVGQAMILRDWFFEKMLANVVGDTIGTEGVDFDKDWFPAWLDYLFTTYTGTLYVALKWNEGDAYAMRSLFTDDAWSTDSSTGVETSIALSVRELRDSWAELFAKWEDYFVMGSDQFLSSAAEATSFEGNMATTMELVEVIAASLTARGYDGEAIADKFASGNAAILYGI